ncbi:MAG: hypothetical protein PHY54_15900 [Methylococcales bacterium]|nr:hypothetical protein [Methylococcales bacterium]
MTTTRSQNKLVEYKRRVAFHEAGYAAGVYLNNKAICLPSIPFKIIFKEMSNLAEIDVMDHQTKKDNYIPQLVGGRLIEMLPHSFDNLVGKLTGHNDAMLQLVEDYRKAFESDIINLLIGPLAEAKHIADSDNEIFKLQLISPNALVNYGGNSGLALLNQYLQCFISDKQKDEKMDELFVKAFYFVNNDTNWFATTRLADYILGSSNIICYEEIVLMLDNSIANFKERRAKARQHYDGWFKVTAQQIKGSYVKSMEVKRPSQAELNSMNQLEKDTLILELFEILGRQG